MNLIKNKHIKLGSSCVTEGLDRNTGYFKRQAGKNLTLSMVIPLISLFHNSFKLSQIKFENEKKWN